MSLEALPTPPCSKLPSNVLLPQSTIESFLLKGMCVVPLLSPGECANLLSEINEIITHRTHFVPHCGPPCTLSHLHDLNRSICSRLSSTNGAGGVMDVHYDPALDKIRTDQRIFSIISKLWQSSYGQSREGFELPPEVRKAFEFDKGYCTCDRICYRVPDDISNLRGRKKRVTRCLTPHLDCCPDTIYSGVLDSGDGAAGGEGPPCRMWRPLQCFLCLTDSVEPDTGGFECASGYHRTFHQWKETRNGGGVGSGGGGTACKGPFSSVRDKKICEDIQHVDVAAGSLVIWDEKVPHSTALKHLGKDARVVIYLGFLPYGGCNKAWKEWERKCWEREEVWVGVNGQNGGGNWISSKEEEGLSEVDRELRRRGFKKEKERHGRGGKVERLKEGLQRKLMGCQEW